MLFYALVTLSNVASPVLAEYLEIGANGS
jgi:hypothetical protein